MSNLSDITIPRVLTGVATVIITATSWALLFGFGSRGIENVYSFKYHGQDAVIKQENVRLFEDNYWIEIGKDKIIVGTITSDDNKTISVNGADTKRSIDKYSIKYNN